MIGYPEWVALLESERLPAAAVDLAAFDRNVEKLAALARASGKKVRIATKSLRVPELIDRVLRKGAPFQGLMCFAAEEARALAERGYDDLLVAYPTLRAKDLHELRRAADLGRKITLIVDSTVGIAAAAEAFKGARAPLQLAVELDVSLRILGAHLGVRRSPIRTMEQLRALLRAAKEHASVKMVGVMAYEAQVAGLGDRNPFSRMLNPVKHLVRLLSKGSVRRRRAAVIQAFEAEGVKLELLNGGGTGSADWAASERALTEITAGSGLLCSHLFDYYSNIRFEPACFFALQVVRRSDEDYVTCQGGGYIASGEPGWDRLPVPWLPAGLRLVSAEGCGEVQTPLRGGGKLALGAPVLFRHAKAGELAERFNEYLLISDGKISARVPTYRGLGWSFF